MTDVEHSTKSDAEHPIIPDGPDQLMLESDNVSTYHEALLVIKDGLTCRVPTLINDPKLISGLCDIIKEFPMGLDTPKEMRKLAKRLKINVQQMGETWFRILSANVQSGYNYCLIETQDKKFVYAFNIGEVADKTGITPLELAVNSKRHDTYINDNIQICYKMICELK